MKVLGSRIEKKTRTSLRLPAIAIEMIKKSMLNQSYGSRERSRWISEAVERLVNKNDFWHLVAEEFMDSGENEVIPLTLEYRISALIKNAEIQMREGGDSKVVDRSIILRAAISQRLITEGGGVVEF
ncbi:MAG: hypothetical protein KUG83_00280 [Gammaproteobacteria bacterium]|nr:hypothetical protein [Gammaproteobacteria bacterium]